MLDFGKLWTSSIVFVIISERPLVIKLSDYVIDFIAKQGVKDVFFLPGGGAMHLNDSLGRHPDIQFVAMQHEQAVAVAAEAYSRVTNDLGVCMVTSGPGGTNAVTGVAAAWLDSTPVLFLSGQVKRADLRKDNRLRQSGVQEIDIVTIVNSITKYAATITEPTDIRWHLEKAVHTAKSGRPGPVWLDIPLDVQASIINEGDLRGYDVSSEFGDPATGEELAIEIQKVVELLNGSERPVILLGNGTRLSGAADLVLPLVEALGVPVLTTRLGVDLLAHDHPLCFGLPGGIASRASNFTVQNCDFLLSIGSRLDLQMMAYAPQNFARAAKKIMVNIDPADVEKLGGHIHRGIVADAREFCKQLLDQRDLVERKPREDWLARCRLWRERYPFVERAALQKTDAISMYEFSDALSAALGPNDVVLPGSSGFAAEIFLTAFKCKTGQRVFHNKGTGAMGFSQPAAIGASLASGGRRTVAVDGDGGFSMNVQELETIKRLNLPIKIFVINNSGYASIRASQGNYFQQLVGADQSSGMSLPDWIEVARAYGISSVQIFDSLAMPGQIDSVLACEGPVVCEVRVIPDEERQPRVSSIVNKDGTMSSRPLEDMYPFLTREELKENMIIDTI